MKSFDPSAVEKPARYLGGETGAIVKDPSRVALRFCLAFPDVYEVGMSHLGHQILYSILNQRSDVYAERAYTPWVDALEQLAQTGAPLFSLETHTPIREFHAIGFTLAYELAATNVLAMLEAGGVPVLAIERGDSDPMILAGGPCASNPEPFADFFDAFLVGDGEEAVLEIADALIAMKNAPREKRLAALAAVPGVYVPSLVDVWLDRDGSVLSISGPRPRHRVVTNLDEWPEPAALVTPNVRAVHHRLTVEIARGCTRGCRFCQAGYIYRPVRERSASVIAAMIDQGLVRTGHDQVSLLSLSACDHSLIEPLVAALIQAKAPEKISVALPSLRIESLSRPVMEQIRRVKRTGFTIAPEAGTQRLRDVLNKQFSDEEIVAAVESVFAAGWDLVKLYFMIGLPTETLEDVEAIVALTHRALDAGRRANKRARMHVNVATYVPKPHTPFQWEPQLALDEARRRLDFIKKKLRRDRINLKWQAPETSLVEGAIARGSRATSRAVLAAYQDGARFDAWTDHFDLARWERAFESVNDDLHHTAARTLSANAVAPWDVVDPGVSREFLLEEKERAMRGEPLPDCRVEECYDCGVCAGDIQNRLASEKDDQPQFAQAAAAQLPQILHRMRLRYSRTGPARFLSHLDLASAMLRAFRRAGLPLAFSEGFSPAPKVEFGPPLPVGVESLDEYVDLRLTVRVEPARLLDAAEPDFFPSGIRVLDAWPVPLKQASLASQVAGATYLATLESVKDWQARLREFQARPDKTITVRRGGKTKQVDLGAKLGDVRPVDENTLLLHVLFDKTGSVNPYAALAGILNVDDNAARALPLLKQRTHLPDFAEDSLEQP